MSVKRIYTEAEAKRIWEYHCNGVSPKNIVNKMVTAGYGRDWATDQVDAVIDAAYDKVGYEYPC